MSEASIRHALKREFKKIKIYSIENHSDPGMSDLHYIIKESGLSGWIELKFVRDGGAIKFRPRQPEWISDYIKCGGVAFVLVKTESRRFYLFHGRIIPQLMSVKEVDFPHLAIAWVSGNSPWRVLEDLFIRETTNYKGVNDE